MNLNKLHTLGIDIGSTTVKIAILDSENEVLFSDYERHFANIQETLSDLLGRALYKLGSIQVSPVITGSGGLTLAKHLGVPFVQEVIAVSTALQDYAPQTDVAIELGGEDAKIIYFEGGNVEQRMNGVCAGGTGSFIDQMASLLQTDASGLNEYAKNYKALYSIAARCGVFAKSDIQPLINEGASKEDLAASIFQAVVNQTISGLACGKPIRGHVAFLGGPLHFLSELRETFIRTLKLDDEHIIAPHHSHLFAAIGSALNSKKDTPTALCELQKRLENKIQLDFEVERLDPLFETSADYDKFISRHSKHQVPIKDLATYTGKAFLGIDAGSTTTKAALVGEDGTLLYSFYHNNDGDPLGTTISAIKDIYRQLPEDVEIGTEQDARDLTFLHLTALPFRTMQRTAAKRGRTAPERSVQCPAEPVAERPAAEGSGPGRPHWRTRQTPSEPQPGRPQDKTHILPFRSRSGSSAAAGWCCRAGWSCPPAPAHAFHQRTCVQILLKFLSNQPW